MPPIVVLAALAVAGALAGAGWLILAPRDRTREQVLVNVTTGLGMPEETASRQTEAWTARLARRIAPGHTVAKLDRLIALAGRPPAWKLERILLGKLLIPCAIAVLGLIFINQGPSATRVVMVALVTAVGHFVPDLLLKSRGQKRQIAIGLELADTLDQMTIAVEAGSGFESAMMRSAKNGKGPLAAELARTLQDMQLGQSRRNAYHALIERTHVPDLRRFLRAVIQADIYGIAVADVLRTQASEMRLKRRQAAEEKAMKIPVKVIFPLMLCILPALFVVLMGPVAIEIMATFGS